MFFADPLPSFLAHATPSAAIRITFDDEGEAAGQVFAFAADHWMKVGFHGNVRSFNSPT
jgi:hypothetical protein